MVSEKPTTVRLGKELQSGVDVYMSEQNVKTSEAIKQLLSLSLEVTKYHGYKDVLNMFQIKQRDYDLGNVLQMNVFLEMKKWEAHENGGVTLIKSEELKRIEEFISCFNDLARNSNIWAERLHDEGYTNFAEVIREASEFL